MDILALLAKRVARHHNIGHAHHHRAGDVIFPHIVDDLRSIDIHAVYTIPQIGELILIYYRIAAVLQIDAIPQISDFVLFNLSAMRVVEINTIASCP
ncbi:hypothetical protein D3C75_576470 [compost metagenome]